MEKRSLLGTQQLLTLNPDLLWSWGLAIAALFLWLLRLGDVPLRDWDEGTFATVAQEMYRSGNWLHPTLQGEPYWNKPPLVEWLITLSYRLGGVNEWTARLPGAIITALGVPLLYGVGRQLFWHRVPAIFSALVYLTLLPVVRHGRLAMRDGMIVSFFLLLLFCALKARQDRRWAVGVGLALGALTLTKGIIAVLLGTIAFLFLLWDHQRPLLRHRTWWLGVAIGYLPAIAWYGAQIQHYGFKFLQVHFFNQSFDRVWQVVESNTGPPWYYGLELLKYGWPWLLFLPSALQLVWRKRLMSWSRLVIVGSVVYLGVISVMRTKLPWYIMPLYPFVAMAIGARLSQAWEVPQRYPRSWAIGLGTIAIAALGMALYFVVADTQWLLIVAGGVLVITFAIGAGWIWQSDRRFIPLLVGGFYLVLALLMASPVWLWELNEAFPVKPVATLIRAHTPPNTVIYTSFSYARPSLNFYSDRPVKPATSQELRQEWIEGNYLLLDQEAIEDLELPNAQTFGEAAGFTLMRQP